MNSIRNAYFRLTILLTLVAIRLCANQDNYQLDANEEPGGCYSKPLRCSQAGHFFIRSDVLYWTPRITGLELNFGTTEIVENVINCTQILTTKEVDLDPHFKWDAGYRIGVGYEADKWKVEALWTHFQGNGKRSTHTDLNITNTGKVNIKFDQIDLALIYDYDLTCSFTFKPFIGVRASRIHEHINALLVTQISLFPAAIALESKIFDDRQKYWGAGPLFGVQGDWEIGCGFGLYGAVAASLLYGDYNVRFNDTDAFTAPVSKQFFSTNKRHVHAFDYNIDLVLGVNWHTLICSQYELDMKLGLEQHQYFNQNRLCVSRGDISFIGGICSLELGF